MANNYSGANTPALVITGVTSALDGNLYRCRATNEFGAVTSESAALTVNAPPVTNALFLPPLTESTGDLYADCAAAYAVTSSPNCNGCSAYEACPNSDDVDFYNFSASGFGSELDYSYEIAGGGANMTNMDMWASIGANVGDVITASYGVGSGDGGTGQRGTLTIYNDSGVQIGSVTNTTGADLVSASLPYTGRYIIRLQAGFETITNPSGSLVLNANPILGMQATYGVIALYDTGSGTGQLNCGDSCP